MDPVSNQTDSSRTAGTPQACPACGSASVTTSAKRPDASSYWRCERCDEIWNVGRRHGGPTRRVGWR